MPANPSMPSPVPSSVTVVLSLGMHASFHSRPGPFALADPRRQQAFYRRFTGVA
jgi:hypothetical protein